jgi:sortase A
MAIIDTSPILEKQSSSSLAGARFLFWLGLISVMGGGTLLFFLFGPLIQAEWQYWRKHTLPTVIPSLSERIEDSRTLLTPILLQPVDTNFGIVIPKIEANAKIIQEVDWQNSTIYQRALREGVAHAKGTALPGEAGNTFIFAHSGVDLAEAARYNAVFYLMNKLEKDDEVRLYYQGKEYQYRVTDKKIVQSNAVDYLNQDRSKYTLTLMTCWPAGTTWKRLVVEAELKSFE